MGQIKGLLRDTWYVWCLFAAMAIGMAVASSKIFLLILVVLPFSMAYFASMRYDKDGNLRADL